MPPAGGSSSWSRMDLDELGEPGLNGRDGTWRGYLQMFGMKQASFCKIARIALCCALDADPMILKSRWQTHHHHEHNFFIEVEMKAKFPITMQRSVQSQGTMEVTQIAQLKPLH